MAGHYPIVGRLTQVKTVYFVQVTYIWAHWHSVHARFPCGTLDEVRSITLTQEPWKTVTTGTSLIQTLHNASGMIPSEFADLKQKSGISQAYDTGGRR